MVILRRLLIWGCCLFSLTPSCLLAMQIADYHIGQVWVALPEITVYMHIANEEGLPVTDALPPNTSLMARVGSTTPSLTESRPFAPETEGTAVVFLVDISKSLRQAQFAPIKKALSLWINAMGERDRAGIVTFGSSVKPILDFTGDRDALRMAVNSLAPRDMNTRLHLGLVRAMEMARRKDADLPLRRAIVTLSDGQNDFAGGLTKAEVLMQMEEDPVPIYGIGFYPPPKTREKEEGLKLLGQFSRTSGGIYFRADTAASIEQIYDKVRQDVQGVWVARMSCPTCPDNGTKARLQISLTTGGRTLSHGVDIRLLPTMTPAAIADENQNGNESEDGTNPDASLEDTPPTPQSASEEAEIDENADAGTTSTENTEGDEDTPQDSQGATASAPTAEENTEFEQTESQDTPSVPSESPLPSQMNSWLYWGAGGGVLLFILVFLMFRRKKHDVNETDSQLTEAPLPHDDSVPTLRRDETPPLYQETPAASHSSSSASMPQYPALGVRVVLMGKGHERETHSLQLMDSATIGRRSGQCDIVITDDDEISGCHCRLERVGEHDVRVRDLDSTNGTLLNGVPLIKEYPLQSGDILLIGRSEIRILF